MEPVIGSVVLMRHSFRLDQDCDSSWDDKDHKPYDTPIQDFELPAQKAMQLKDINLGSVDLIICSTSRRCLQAAGVVAKVLACSRVRTNYPIGADGVCAILL